MYTKILMYGVCGCIQHWPNLFGQPLVCLLSPEEIPVSLQGLPSFLGFLYGCMNVLAAFCGFCSAWFWISHALHCHQICDCTTHLYIRSKQTCATVCLLSLVITRNLLAKRANYMLILAFCHISISMYLYITHKWNDQWYTSDSILSSCAAQG